MSKKLTLVQIKNEVKKYNEKEKIQLDEHTHVFIYPHFSPSKIRDMLAEMLTDKLKAEEKGIDFDSINMADWFSFNIIRYFCDLGIPSEIKKKVEYFLVLRDYDHFETILNSFPEESLKRTQEIMEKVNQNMTKLTALTTENIEGVIDEVLKVENEDVH